MWIFTDAIIAGRPIPVFNQGDMKRDFAYVDDIVTGVLATLDQPAQCPEGRPPHKLYNIGNSRSEDLMRLIGLLEQAIGRKAEIQFKPMQPGDVKETYADISAIARDVGYAPTTPIDIGVPKFVEWFRAHHRV